MRRRTFVSWGAARGLAGLPPMVRAAAQDDSTRFHKPSPLPFREDKSGLKITNIRAVRLVPERPLPKYQPTPGYWNTTDVEIANPLSIYPRFKPRRSLFYADDLGPLEVMVETNKGITGFGFGGPGAAFVVERHLPKLLVGEDPFDVERLWDIMWRGTLYYGRKGVSFVYTLLDNGTTNGVNDFKSSSATASFAVTEINDPPTGVDDVLPNVLEDSGEQTIPFATLLANDLTGPANESGQSLTIVLVDNAVGGSVSIVGTDLIFTPPADYNGPASFVYTLVDNGTTNGQPDPKTSTATVSFTIDAVNDAPLFVKGTDQAATDENPATHLAALPVVVPGWATQMAPGPATATDEAGQTLSFTVTNDNVGLFVAQPAVDSTGKLTFTPAPNGHGTAHVTVVLKDDGGTAHGGVDASSPQTFDIVISKPHIWHNTRNPLDVNDDGHVAANDAVAVINYINGFGNINGGHVPALGATIGNTLAVATYGGPFGYLDVNADDFVAASDVLAIINVINAGQGGEGEPVTANPDVDLMTLLAIDVAAQTKRRR